MDKARLNMYGLLLKLPLFQGLGYADLSEIVGHTRFQFLHCPACARIVDAGAPCTDLVFLIKGLASAVSDAADLRFSVEEEVSAPSLFQPEFLFGLTPRYTQTFTTVTECDLLMISKLEFSKLISSYEIFRTNYLNIISTRNQRLSLLAWRPLPDSIRERITRFLKDHCQWPSGRKIFHIKMQQIADVTGDSRINVSRELHAMDAEQLLHVSRGQIVIPAIERL